MGNYLFVYGTLKKNNDPHSEFLFNKLEYVGTGTIRAKLYDLGDYPGITESNNTIVYGELYQILDIKNLSKIDEYEETNPVDTLKGLYVRNLVQVNMDDGSNVQAFAYFYNKNIEHEKEIPSGRWDTR